MTPAEFKKKARNKLRIKHIQEIVWSDVASVVSGSSQADKDRIVQSIKEEKPAMLGRLVQNMMLSYINTNVETELNTIIADDNISLTEFDRIFGD